MICAAAAILPVTAQESQKLEGTPIGTHLCFNYSTGQIVEDEAYKLFDGDLYNYFATYERSYTWAGLDLGRRCVITRAGWAPRNDGLGPGRVVLGVIQGANSPDFLDAVPIYIIRERGVIGQMHYGDINCSRGFRYVRYVGPSDARCNLAELEFYGYEGEGDDSALYQFSNLPTVAINTVDAEEPYDKEHDIPANVIIIDNGAVNIDKSATVRERGNASREFPKKPWRIKFDKKQTPLDAVAKAKKWTLINNYGDKSLMRNLVAFEIARRLNMPFVPFARAVDVVLNGEYKGTYQLCDQVEVNPGRVEITEMETTDIEGEALTGGYLVEVDAYADQEPAGEWFSTNRGTPVTIKSPDDGGVTQQYNYIRNYFNTLESLLFSSNFSDPQQGYRKLFDVDSFLRHFIVGELSGNTDTYWSTYMFKDRGDELIHTGPVWDFDIAFDNDYRTYPIDRFSGFLYDSGAASAAAGMRDFTNRIIKRDPATKDELARVWSLARNDNDLTAESLSDYISALEQEMEQSAQLNFMRWPILNQQVHMNPRALGSFKQEVQALRSYLNTRFKRLDPLMGYDANLSAVQTVEAPEFDLDVVNHAFVASTPFSVYNAQGMLVEANTCATAPLTPGIYIVTTTDGKSMKIALR